MNLLMIIDKISILLNKTLLDMTRLVQTAGLPGSKKQPPYSLPVCNTGYFEIFGQGGNEENKIMSSLGFGIPIKVSKKRRKWQSPKCVRGRRCG